MPLSYGVALRKGTTPFIEGCPYTRVPPSYKGVRTQGCLFHIRVPLHKGASFIWGALRKGCPDHTRVPLNRGGVPFI